MQFRLTPCLVAIETVGGDRFHAVPGSADMTETTETFSGAQPVGCIVALSLWVPQKRLPKRISNTLGSGTTRVR